MTTNTTTNNAVTSTNTTSTLFFDSWGGLWETCDISHKEAEAFGPLGTARPITGYELEGLGMLSQEKTPWEIAAELGMVEEVNGWDMVKEATRVDRHPTVDKRAFARKVQAHTGEKIAFLPSSQRGLPVLRWKHLELVWCERGWAVRDLEPLPPSVDGYCGYCHGDPCTCNGFGLPRGVSRTADQRCGYCGVSMWDWESDPFHVRQFVEFEVPCGCDGWGGERKGEDEVLECPCCGFQYDKPPSGRRGCPACGHGR